MWHRACVPRRMLKRLIAVATISLTALGCGGGRCSEPDATEAHVARVAHPGGPRCTPSDDRCEPIAYEACFQSRLFPSAPRYARNPERAQPLPVARPENACVHDGECVTTGCGNGCGRWDVDHGSGTCLYYTTLSQAFCGCVENQCRWFTQ